MANVLGIDLGTTYSCVAYVNDFGQAEVLLNKEEKSTTPSVVVFPDGNDSQVYVGDAAKNAFRIQPENGVMCIKRSIVKDECYHKPTKFPLGLTPTDISAYILKKLVDDANAALGRQKKPITNVVITVPADFGNDAKLRTAQAAEQAGLNLLQMVNEPTAAAIAYGIRRTQPQTVLVYDLGGGTFDATILQVRAGEIAVIASNGDRFCGGYDWDARIALKILEEYNRRFHTDFSLPVTEDEVLAAEPKIQKMRASLLLEAEEIKKMLTDRRSMTTSWFFEEDGHGLSDPPFEITREVFEAETVDLLDHTIDVVNEVLEAAKEKGISQIDKWLLVGGSSRMPQVAARLKEEFNCRPALTDPDQCVAKGAAVLAESLNTKTIDNGNEGGKKADIRIKDVCSKTYGLGVINDEVSNMIFKNTPIPYTYTCPFVTIYDNQTGMDTEIYESDATEKRIPRCYATCIYKGFHAFNGPKPKAYELMTTFYLDESGILHVSRSAADGSTSKEQVQIKGIISEAEMKARQQQVKKTLFK